MKIPTVPFLTFLPQAGEVLKNPLPFHRKYFAELGDIFRVNLGFGNDVIFTRDAGLAKHMLQTQHKKYHKSPIQTDHLGRYVGKGLLTANGPLWRKQRRLIQPAFYKKKLAEIQEIIVAAIRVELEKIPPNEEVAIFPIMNNSAFKVVGKSLFNYGEDDKAIDRLQQITEEIQIRVIKQIRQPFKKWWFSLTGEFKATDTLAAEARQIIRSFIEKRQAQNQVKNDLLDILLEATYDDGSKMSMEQLIDEIIILFVAGHETVSDALVFSLQLLAKHPKIQNKVYDEVKDSSASDLDMMAFFEALPFTTNCINEAMRLYPPVYFSDRIAMESDEYNNLKINKGTSILFSFYEIHRAPEFWEYPDDFKPERFDSISKKELSQWFYPFGAGPRMCVGSNFAMFELLVTVSEIIKKYKVQPLFTEIKIKPLITLKPVNAILEFIARD